jgi:Ca2+-binding EF-hand superfamily protein
MDVDDDDDRDSQFIALEDLRRMTGLNSVFPQEVTKIFESHQDCEEGLHLDSFTDSLTSIMQLRGIEASDNEVRFVAANMFDMFDKDHNGIVDFAELASGLSVLCAGDRDEKITAAFALYDTNGDGVITLAEMKRYLRSVFRVLYSTSKETRAAMSVSPEDLADVTAEQCFLEADLNNDHKLSLEEFKKWFNKPSNVSSSGMTEKPSWLSLDEARRLAGLSNFEPDEVFEEFAHHADEDGALDRDAFMNAFFTLVDKSDNLETEEELLRAEMLFDMIFEAFDADGNGFIDFNELSSGVSVLCGGSTNTKIQAAFSLYDLNGDGFISLEEMTSYLTCVFRMLYQLQPGTSEQMGVSANELGAATAAQAFEDADLNHDGRISFDEFREFYLQSNNVTAEEEGDGEEYPGLQMNLNVAKQLSCLHHYHVEDVFTEFANYANEDGLLDRRTFTKCFSQLILATDTLCQRE